MNRKIKVQRKIPPPHFLTPRWSSRNKTRPAGFQSSKPFATTLGWVEQSSEIKVVGGKFPEES